MQKLGIKHIRVAPYRPQSNGLAERMVQTMKHSLKAAMTTGDGRSVEAQLGSFLMQYRNTQHATTGVAPAEAMLGRRVRTRMDLLRPNTAENVLNAQAKQMQRSRQFPEYAVGARVLVRNYSGGAKWKRGTVVGRTGPVSYTVTVDGLVWSRHAGQLLQARDDKKPEANQSRVTATSTRALDGLADPPEPSTEQPLAAGTREGSAQQSADQPVQQPADQPADQPVQPDQQSADQPVQQPEQQPADQPVQQAADWNDTSEQRSADDTPARRSDKRDRAAPRAGAAESIPAAAPEPDSVTTRSGRRVKTHRRYEDFVSV